jgi:hypothetical protein
MKIHKTIIKNYYKLYIIDGGFHEYKYRIDIDYKTSTLYINDVKYAKLNFILEMDENNPDKTISRVEKLSLLQ